MSSKLSLYLLVILFISGVLNPLHASDYSQHQLDHFEKHIRPALIKYCYECHSVEEGTTRGGLLLDTRLGWAEGGDNGPAIVPGKIDESLLWEAITWEGDEMPPSRKMPADIIEHFKTWIEMGAPDPRVRQKMVYKPVLTKEKIEVGKQFWSFQKPNPESASLTIDQAIQKSLKAANLKQVTSAPMHTLLRRMTLDLTGLPPTPEDISAFENDWRDNRNQAIENKIDDLLSREQFGERWGRHWLDVARYAESSGMVNVVYPHAWRYRDYVIDSFNQDKPYDQFIREQIAGDLLPAATDEARQKNLIATGYLAVGIKRQDERNPRQFQMDMIDEQLDTVSQSILGLTVACARCHDHKSDPIPTADYYALAGIFKSTNTMYGTNWGLQNHRPADLIRLPIVDDIDQMEKVDIQEIKRQISNLNQLRREKRDEARRTGQVNQRMFVAMRNHVARLEGQLKVVDEDGMPITFGMGVMEQPEYDIADCNILITGDIEKPAQEVKRGFLQVLGDVPVAGISEKESGRLQLAEWLTSRENPLTARVMINRVWMHLMGSPLVATPNNWGPSGLKPTHPELLDALAVQFMNDDWSIKSMIKRIMLSSTYQLSSEFNETAYARDPDNKLHWRHSPRQLDAEALRDSMLAVSGQLELQRPYGSEMAELGNGRFGRDFNEASFSRHNRHRSIYLPIIRDNVHESLKLFDFADPNSSSDQRSQSIVATQALYILNSDFMKTQSRAMAIQLTKAHRGLQDQVAAAFIQVYARPATEQEIKASVHFIRQIDPELAVKNQDQFHSTSFSTMTTRTTTADDKTEQDDETSQMRRQRRFEALMRMRIRQRMAQERNRRQEGEAAKSESASKVSKSKNQSTNQSMYQSMNDANQRQNAVIIRGQRYQRGMRQSRRAEQDGAAYRQAKQSLEKAPLGLALFCQSLLASAEFRIQD